MKLLGATLLALVGAGVTAASSEKPVSYDGYKVYRIWTHGRVRDIKAQLDEVLTFYDRWNDDVDAHLDVVVAPDEVDAFQDLGLEYKVMHDDLGTSINTESSNVVPASKWKRQEGGDNDAWFDSYHLYEDHIQYFEDLHAAFPNNSELVSSGKSHQGRNIYGLHLYGNDGPGKPAILYHGTVHAREWIVAPVRDVFGLTGKID